MHMVGIFSLFFMLSHAVMHTSTRPYLQQSNNNSKSKIGQINYS